MFKDEKSARAGGNFKLVYENIMAAEESNEVSLTIANTYCSSQNSKGTIVISKSGDKDVITFDGILLTNSDKKKFQLREKFHF